MHPSFLRSLVDDGSHCWMTPPEAAVYTGTSTPTVTRALLNRELIGSPTPGGRLRDSLVARADLDRWMDREPLNRRLPA